MQNIRMLIFYRFCAAALLAAILVVMSVKLLIALRGPASVDNLPTALIFPMGLIGAVGAFAFFALWPCMMWHCLVVNKATPIKKIFWFMLLLFTLFVGTLVYYGVEIEAEA